jgi:hypothetical protein
MSTLFRWHLENLHEAALGIAFFGGEQVGVLRHPVVGLFL